MKNNIVTAIMLIMILFLFGWLIILEKEFKDYKNEQFHSGTSIHAEINLLKDRLLEYRDEFVVEANTGYLIKRIDAHQVEVIYACREDWYSESGYRTEQPSIYYEYYREDNGIIRTEIVASEDGTKCIRKDTYENIKQTSISD